MILDLFKYGNNVIKELKNSDVFNFSSGFTQQLSEDEKALRSFQAEIAKGTERIVAINNAMVGASSAAKEYAQTHEITNDKINEFVSSQRQSQIAVAARSSSFKTQASIINTYNHNLNKLGMTEDEFADAVRQGNVHLGDYLSNVKSGDAHMGKYVLSLIKAKAATIGLNIVTSLLNAGLTMLISIGVSAVFNAISESITAAKDRMDEANSSINELSDSLKTIEDYKEKTSKLREELDKGGLSLSEVTDKRKELYDIQKDLIDKYGDEARGIDVVTTSVEKQAEAYDELNSKILAAWMSKNRTAVYEARNNIYGEYKDGNYVTNGAHVSGLEGYGYAENAEASGFTKWLDNWLLNHPGISKERAKTDNGVEYVITFDGSRKEIIENIDALDTAITEYKDSSNELFEQEKTNAQAILNALSTKRSTVADEYYNESERTYQEATQIVAQTKGVYKNYYKDITDLNKQYNDAVAKNDEEGAEKAYTAVVDKYNDIINNGTFEDTDNVRGEDIKTYFENQLQDFMNLSVPVRLRIDIEGTKREFHSTKGELTRLYSMVGENGFGLNVDSRGIPTSVAGYNNVSLEQANEFNTIKEAAKAAGVSIESYIEALVQYGKVRDDTFTENSGQKLTTMLTKYSDALTKLKTAYDLADEAEKEMVDGGLSAETVKKLADTDKLPDTVKDYIDYLYEENGVIKLNTEAWKENADKGVKEQMSALQKSQDVLLEERDGLKEASEAVEYYNSVLREAESLGVTPDKTVFGNIDTNNRQVLEWTDENLSKYKDAIESWGSTTEELKGSISTVFGASDNFDGLEIAFSPMLQTDKGAVLLSADTVYDYIWGLIDKLSESGKEWTNEDLLKLDAEGLEIDGQKIKGLIADIGETAIQTGESMHFAGKDGAVAQAYKDLQQYADKYGVSVDELINKCNGLSSEINTNETAMRLLEGAFNSITNPFEKLNDAYGEALSNFENINSLIQTISSSMTTLADIQEAVANGFTLSLDKALEFASVYPQILDGAMVSADGQITLNEDIVNSFIESKQMELKEKIDAQIKSLNIEKEKIKAQKELAEAELKMAKSLAEGKGKLTADLVAYRIDASNKLQKALVDAGVDEAKAYKLAALAMAGNTQEFNKVAKDVCTDVAGNFNEAAYTAAQAIRENMYASQIDVAALTRQVQELGRAFAAAPGGQVAGDNSIKQGSNGGVKINSQSIRLTSGQFNGVDYSYTPKTVSLDKFISDIELDISSFENAMKQIDGQIATLEAMKNIPLEHFTSSYKEKVKKAQEELKKTNSETWFDRAYKDHKHRVAMDQETESAYLDWLNSAYKKAYNENIISLDDYYKYEEEVYNGRKKLVGDTENWFEQQYKAHQHYLKMEEESEADYLKWLNSAYQKAFDQGLIKLEDYRKYREEVYSGLKNLASTAESSIKELVNIRLNMLKEEIEKEKEALNTKLNNLKDFYQKQKDMLQESYDNEKYLEEQAEKRKSVADIQAEIDQLRFDDSAKAHKRRIELEKELKEANKTLSDFERDHTLKTAQDQYDKLYEQQEKTITEETAAKLYERALNDVRNGSVSLYNEMIAWNEKYGDGITENITKAWEAAYKAEKNYYDYTGQHYNGVNLANATGYYVGKRGYASGTSHSTAGIHKVDEQGIETIFQSSDGQRYRMFSSGEKVLNASASDFLYKFANKGREILDKLFNSTSHSYNNVSPSVVANNIQQGDIIIQGNADKATVSEIRRAQRENLEQMLKQLNRLK